MQKSKKINLFRYEFHFELVCRKIAGEGFKTTCSVAKNIRQSRQYKRFMAKARKNLPQVCFNCDSTENIELHHIIGIQEDYRQAMTLENIVPLCRTCHTQAHDDMREAREFLKVS
jgi:5-methylcytosine-specific restriction endonuclease McrA